MAPQNTGSLAAADEFGGQKKVKFIHQTGRKKGSMNFGAAFHQKAVNPALPQNSEQGRQVHPVVPGGGDDDLGAQGLNGSHFVARGGIGADNPGGGSGFHGQNLGD